MEQQTSLFHSMNHKNIQADRNKHIKAMQYEQFIQHKAHIANYWYDKLKNAGITDKNHIYSAKYLMKVYSWRITNAHLMTDNIDRLAKVYQQLMQHPYSYYHVNHNDGKLYYYDGWILKQILLAEKANKAREADEEVESKS